MAVGFEVSLGGDSRIGFGGVVPWDFLRFWGWVEA